MSGISFCFHIWQPFKNCKMFFVTSSFFFSRCLNFPLYHLSIEEKAIVKKYDGKYIFKILNFMAYSNNWICSKLFNFSRRKDIQVLKLDTIVECSNVAQGKFYKKKKKMQKMWRRPFPGLSLFLNKLLLSANPNIIWFAFDKSWQ